MAQTMLLIPVTLDYPLSGTQPANHGTKVVDPNNVPALVSESYFKETASQSYVVGDLIYVDGANGTIAVCTTATTAGMAQLTSPILGQPGNKATGVTGAPVAFAAFQPTSTYIMNAFHTTPASAVFTQAMLMDRFNIVKSAAGLWHVDVLNAVVSTLPMVRIVGFPQSGLDSTGTQVVGNGPGDINGLAYVQFVPTFTTGAVTGLLDALQMWS